MSKNEATDTLFTLNRLEYGKFQVPEQIAPIALVSTTFQIATICIMGAEHARELILGKKPG